MADIIDNKWFFRRGTLAANGWQSVVDSSIPGWQHTGLRVADLSDGASISLAETGVERLVIPLAGSFRVAHGNGTPGAGTANDVIQLSGRTSVFDGPTDVLYVPASETLSISGQGRVAVASARTDVMKPVQYIPAADTPIELRGAGKCSRQIHNFGTPQALDAARIIVCEVITPGGNFSSYPAHKHDENVPGHESRLEEIYYFELAGPRDPGPDVTNPAAGMFATYSSPAGEIATNAIVHTGDIALVPFGFHGPAAALPGYDMYYLNVMAGPDPEREWLITDDPAQTWVRGLWDNEAIDPRLPLNRAEM
ncbi:MAG: 5-deoxy-glucuronate isomerase [Nakamurella sp.]